MIENLVFDLNLNQVIIRKLCLLHALSQATSVIQLQSIKF